MTQEELLNIVHELRNNIDCSDEQLCEVIKAAKQTINFENIAKLIGERPAKEENEGKKSGSQIYSTGDKQNAAEIQKNIQI